MSEKTQAEQLEQDFELTSLTNGEDLHKKTSHRRSPNVLILDSAHSWLICFANFILMTLGSSFGRTLNMTFLNFVDDFQVTITKASIGFTLQLVCFSLTSMLVTALVVPKIGERITCVIGSTLGSISTLGIGWSPNIACFLFFMAMKGISTGTTSVASIAMISQYFDKRKSFATAVACSGLALGSMGAPPIAKLLIETYGRQGAFLLLGAVEMNNIGMSMLLRPINRYARKIKSEHEIDSINENTDSIDIKSIDIVKPISSSMGDNKSMSSETDVLARTIIDAHCLTSDQKINGQETDINSGQETDIIYDTGIDSNHLTTLLTPLNELKADKCPFNESILKTQISSNSEHSSKTHRSIAIEMNEKILAPEDTYSRSLEQSYYNTVGIVLERLNSYDFSNNHRRTSLGRRASKLNVSSTWSIISTPVSDVLVGFDLCTLQENTVNPDKGQTNRACCLKMLLWFHNAFNIQLFRTWSLRALLLYNATGVIVLYLSTYFPTIGIKAGLTTEDVALMLMISGGVDFVSRLAIGAFTDLHILTIPQIVALSQVIIGTACHFTHFYTSFEALMALAVFIGVFGGLRQSLGSLICLQFMGAERYIQALGFQTMTATLSMAIHHPLLSSILDVSGSFNIALHYVGVAAYLSAVILLLEPLTKKLDKKIFMKENS